MKKIYFLIAIMAVVMFTSSALSTDRFGSRPGSTAAPIALTDNGKSVRLADNRGRYVLLSFWQSSDAASRQMCNTYSSWLKTRAGHIGAADGNIVMMGVNFDSSHQLFRMIVQSDCLDAKSQFNVSGETADRIRKDYHLGDALGTLLIGPAGRVVKATPSLEDLAML